MPTWTDFCDADVRQCSKNIGLKRIHMPQINTPFELRQLRKMCEGLGFKTSIRYIKNVCREKIYTSQSEVNQSKAEQIPVEPQKRPKVPVIMMKYKNEYMILDGHHRWLAHHLKCAGLYIVQIDVCDTLKKSFHIINKYLKRHPTTFHKRHCISESRRSGRYSRSARKAPLRRVQSRRRSNNSSSYNLNKTRRDLRKRGSK